MKKTTFLISVFFTAILFAAKGQENPSSDRIITLTEKKVYTVPANKKWKIDAKTLDQITFCEDADCAEGTNFFRTVAQKAKNKKFTIEGHMTISAGMSIKITDTPIRIVEQPDS